MWSWFAKNPRTAHDPAQLEAAEVRLKSLHERADRVVPRLHERRARNHWGETIAAIARRERL